ncbi:MAG: hypothetical protein PHR45_02900 [Muribaculaceae bacterium]|nr:hypothetical protein [Muribaculaceae bacterium]
MVTKAWINIILVICLFGGMSCSKKVSERINIKEEIVGNDRDNHGCISSAGYIWSDVRNDCIRIFEEGMPLRKIGNSSSSVVAYLVFSSDSTRLEAFSVDFSDFGGKVLLYREREKGNSWSQNSKFAGSYKVTKDNGSLTLYKGHQAIYRK